MKTTRYSLYKGFKVTRNGVTTHDKVFDESSGVLRCLTKSEASAIRDELRSKVWVSTSYDDEDQSISREEILRLQKMEITQKQKDIKIVPFGLYTSTVFEILDGNEVVLTNFPSESSAKQKLAELKDIDLRRLICRNLFVCKKIQKDYSKEEVDAIQRILHEKLGYPYQVILKGENLAKEVRKSRGRYFPFSSTQIDEVEMDLRDCKTRLNIFNKGSKIAPINKYTSFEDNVRLLFIKGSTVSEVSKFIIAQKGISVKRSKALALSIRRNAKAILV